MKWMLWMLGMMFGIGGCATHTVKCDAHLQPINKPAPATAASRPAPAAAVESRSTP